MKDANNAWERIVQILHYNDELVIELNQPQKRHATQLL